MGRDGVVLAAALVFLAAAAAAVIEAREEVRAREAARAAARVEAMTLRDEWRSLYLEYQTVTRYEVVAAAAARLGMAPPEAGSGRFVVLPAPAAGEEEDRR